VSGRPLRFLRRRWPSVLFLLLPFLRVFRVIRAARSLRVLPAARVVGSSYRAVGTARVEEEAGRLFPGARILRLDADTTTKRAEAAKLWHAITVGAFDVLIATQMLFGGPPVPRVGLVGIPDADAGLRPDQERPQARQAGPTRPGRHGRRRRAGRPPAAGRQRRRGHHAPGESEAPGPHPAQGPVALHRRHQARHAGQPAGHRRAPGAIPLRRGPHAAVAGALPGAAG
jgi:hypothetical protein